MFYQNSNDLVKRASSKSGHVQNSNETRKAIVDYALLPEPTHNKYQSDTQTLSIGTVFQNMIQSIIQKESNIESMTSAGSLNNDPNGEGGGTYNMSQSLEVQAEQEKKYKEQEFEHINRMNSVVDFINLDNQTTRNRWTEVIDSNGVSKYGYITKDGIFQAWLHPSSVENNPNNWLETDNMKKNAGVIGCPATSSSIQKINIAGTWEELKPYDMVYAHNDTQKKNPLFMIIKTSVRNPKNTPGQSGLFSCGNESSNIFVTQRPSADFEFKGTNPDTLEMGCYVISKNISDADIVNRGFTFQEDLFESSIAQCKRRAEDLGKSYFMIAGPDPGKPANRGKCWVYTGSEKPNISGILDFSTNGSQCHRVNNPEDDEDGFMKAYGPSELNRYYGKNTSNSRSVALYSLKTGGLTGVDTSPAGGYIGRIAYININGERRNYPSSTLSFNTTRDGSLGSYLNLGNYDTRSLNDSYALTEINPGNVIASINLLYKASRDGGKPSIWWRKCSNKGPTYTRIILSDGRELGSYSSKSWPTPKNNKDWETYWIHDEDSFVYDGKRKYYATNSVWGKGNSVHLVTSRNYFPFFGGYDTIFWFGEVYVIGAAMHSDNSGNGIFGSKRWDWKWINLGRAVDLETYSVDTKRFPQTFPPDYNIKLDRVTIGESISATNSQCKELCSGENKCGGYVYTEGENGLLGQCELKDRSKMYPIGLRSVDTKKKLMLKVPTINSNIDDVGCKINNGRYKKVDTAQYLHYPFIGNMSSWSKCDIKKILPKEGSLNSQNALPMVQTVKNVFGDAQTNIDVFRYQMTGSKGKYVMYGDWIGKEVETQLKTLENGKVIHVIEDYPFTKMVSMDGKQEKYYEGKISELNLDKWNKSSNTGGGKYLVKMVADAGSSNANQVIKENFETESYTDIMKKVQKDLNKIANSEYQRERLLAMTEESNKQLIAESYKFILWSILAILVVLALIKLKEMFGQDDVEEDTGEKEGGILATILGLFGIGKIDTSDIADKTGDIKQGLSNAGEEFMKASDELSTNITQGADNLVTSVSDAATGAVEGAKNMADKVSETATDAVNKIGDTTSSPPVSASASAPASASGGRSKRK